MQLVKDIIELLISKLHTDTLFTLMVNASKKV